MTASRLKRKLKIIVFGSDTRAGRVFDIILLWTILISILLIIFESVPSLEKKYGILFRMLEWVITVLFTIEYLIRVWVVSKKRGYVFSFFGIIDLLSIVPVYLSLFFPSVHFLVIMRAIRLLRIFRIYQLSHYLNESAVMGRALIASLKKVTVFLSVLLVVVMILGTIMYVVEDGKNGFETIPQSIYWAIVTITTVGYGDVTPMTVLGKIISSFIMLLGYAIIAVPTGIISSEITKEREKEKTKAFYDQERVGECPACGLDYYDPNAKYCRNCGHQLKVVASSKPSSFKLGE